jgi:hypothetical protein
VKPLAKLLLFIPALLGLLLPSLPAATEPQLLAQTDQTQPSPVLERELSKALSAKIITIVDKAKPSPTSDNHDYISYARYWWPDPAKPDGLPYIARDGQHNREQVAAGDRKKIDTLVDSVTVLALGWSQLHREDCAQRAGEWLRAWFVTPATRMKPALDYAQVRLGHNKNLGNASGVLDTRGFAELVGAVKLLHGSPGLSVGDEAAIHQWFTDFYGWLGTGDSAVKEHAAKNNHGSWFLVQAVAIARFLGRDDEARHLCEEDRARIGLQFEPDGRQPLELDRADALHYSHFNLQAQLQLAQLAARWASTCGTTPRPMAGVSRLGWPIFGPSTTHRKNGRTNRTRSSSRVSFRMSSIWPRRWTRRSWHGRSERGPLGCVWRGRNHGGGVFFSSP